MKFLKCVGPRTVCLFLVLGIALSNATDSAEIQSFDLSDTSSEYEDATYIPSWFRRITDDFDPERIRDARPISSILVDRNLTKFLELLYEAGLTESIDSMDSVTLFVPTDEALTNNETESKLEELRADKDKLREVLLFHTTRTKLEKCSDTKVESGLVDKSIRLNKYSKQEFHWTSHVFTAATAECARILNFDDKACDGKVHEIDRLILPPTGSVYDVIQSNPNFTILREVLQGSGLERTLKSRSPITFLAPVNEAFTKLKDGELERLKNDKYLASVIIRRHIFPEILCCAGVGKDSTWLRQKMVGNLLGSTVRLIRGDDDVIYVERGAVLDCDNMATNGIIHSVDTIMMTRPYCPIWNPIQKNNELFGWSYFNRINSYRYELCNIFLQAKHF